MKDGCCEKCAGNKEKLKPTEDPHVQFSPKRTPSNKKNLSGVAVPRRLAEERERRRDMLCKFMAEMKIEMNAVSDSIGHQLFSVLARGLRGFAVDHNAFGHSSLSEHRIETGNSLAYRQRARRGRYARRNFIERQFPALLRLGMIS